MIFQYLAKKAIRQGPIQSEKSVMGITIFPIPKFDFCFRKKTSKSVLKAHKLPETQNPKSPIKNN
jgi:hypothetical protein